MAHSHILVGVDESKFTNPACLRRVGPIAYRSRAA